MYNKLVHKETRLALVGLGYVGLPIALEFAKKISVIGFDINEERLTMMRQGIPVKNWIPKRLKMLISNLPLLLMNCGRLPFLSLPFLHR
mgnify:CR=1 FL=1